MAKYRIKEHNLSYNRTTFEIQRRILFIFWYNPENIDGCTTGFYDTIGEANDAIVRLSTPTTYKIHDR